MRSGSPSRGRIRAQRQRRGSPIRFNRMNRPQKPSRREIIRAKKRNAQLETLLARVDKFIAGKNSKLELATAHHKRCTVLSSLGRHEEALKASQKACLMLKKMALQLERDAAEKPSARRNRARETLVFCWLAIAIYAEGVEHEYLERPSKAENLFAAAISVAKAKLGPQHATTQRLQRLTAHEAPLPQKSHMRSQGTRKTTRRKRTITKQKETKKALPTLSATTSQLPAKTVETAKTLEKSAEQIENMETMLEEKRKKRMNIRKRRQHRKNCEEARAVLYASGQRALFLIARDLKRNKRKNKLKSKISQAESKTTATKSTEGRFATSEPSPSRPSSLDKSRLKQLLRDEAESPDGKKKLVSGAASPIAIKVERGKGTISYTKEELDTVLSPVQQSIIAANECREQLDRHPHPHPAGERYWNCMLDSDPWSLQPGEAESVLTRLRISLLELINQRAVGK